MRVRDTIAKELHRQARRNFPRRRVTLKGLSDLYQADLVEMIPHSRLNKGYKYIMTMINCFSKMAFAVPLKSKTGVEVSRALEPILKKHKMKHFQTDDGKEWYNTHVKKLMEKYSINHYSTFSEMKASIVERLNRTIKLKMYRQFTSEGSYRWLEMLPKILKQYNNTVHRSTGMKPKDVKSKHVKTLLSRLDKKDPIKREKKLQVNDRVRINKFKKTFAKGYLPNWTNEVFTIYAVRPTNPTTYILQDSLGNVLKGGFYYHELQKTATHNEYLVEKVLKKKGGKALVRWLGFDKSHDSWIDAKDIVV